MAKSPLPFRIIPCGEWGAKAPAHAIQRAGRPERTIFHHTAGHVPNKTIGETYAEAIAYALSIQNYHMSQGWADSGHNFLVTRGGFILEGRHGSISGISSGRMVVSAHCPGQNDQPGIEHEHFGKEEMTAIQREATVWLHAWICRKTKMSPATIMQPHRRFYATSCPGSLEKGIPNLRAAVLHELHPPPDDDKAGPWWDKYGPKQKPAWLWPLLREYARRLEA